MNTDVLFEPITSIASRIQRGTLSPPQLLQLVWKRIEDTDKKVKVYVTLCKEDATKAALRAEREIEAGRYLGPLHGIPISIKDLMDTRGVRTSYGSPIFKDHFPLKDAAIVARLKRAGAIIVGKTSTHEFAMGGDSPPTRNPWMLERTPGGSSGGSAASVAVGSAIASVGSDTGGSIRTPASFCGVVGLKPEYGRISARGVFPDAPSFDHVGPITKYVEDSALMLHYIGGHKDGGNASKNEVLPNCLGHLKGGIQGLKVGLPRNHFFENVQPAVLESVNKAADTLEDIGASVKEVSIPSIAEIISAWMVMVPAEVAVTHRGIYQDHAREYRRESREFIEKGFHVPAYEYIAALRSKRKLTREVVKVMREVDLLLTPTQPMVAPKLGEKEVIFDEHREVLFLALTRFVAPFNFTGLPALSMCCGFDKSGMPIGLQLIGRPFDEETVLKAAYSYEQATPWHKALAQIPMRG